ncbi:MAG: Zn-ribbon domain-containing OB-fold protein [Desulfobacterales bacterium]|nr:Zn-ribbon domain-containing OB-fold protein [Desulfobacterales bacterium]
MEDIFEGVAPLVHRSQINVPYSWWAGDTASRFFVALRDQKKIMGTRCEACNRTFVPPRKTCPVCFGENSSWVEVSCDGVVESYTVARRQLAALPRKVPVIFGLIRLDGADTAILHYLDGVAPEDIRMGMRVTACFSAAPTGQITDITHFKPL